MFSWLRNLFTTKPIAETELPTAWLYRVQYDVTETLPQLYNSIIAGRQAMYRINSNAYLPAMRELSNFIGNKFGEASPEKNAVASAPVICSKCTVMFPVAWKMKAAFSPTEGAPCPGCGSNEALLVFVVHRPENITQADVEALRSYWQSKGEDNEEIDAKLVDGIEQLKQNQYYWGMHELWLAHSYISEQAAGSVQPSDAEIKARYDELFTEATINVVVAASIAGKELNERDAFNEAMAQVRKGLNEWLPNPLTDAEFIALMNK